MRPGTLVLVTSQAMPPPTTSANSVVPTAITSVLSSGSQNSRPLIWERNTRHR
ncbi:hypothetical protein [Streptosporangium vulgare]|uniref:hypothetical protein n=1 Tax=Streptosporangium vulgare TaxID=46190 RepID=UPI0031CFE90D